MQFASNLNRIQYGNPARGAFTAAPASTAPSSQA
jgi:hypothetical protein